MYTIEDINKAKQYLSDNGYGTGSNFTLNAVANLMAEYAAKNCVIPAVSVSVLEQIRQAFADYRRAEGCSCCRDNDAYKEAEKRLAELLKPMPYDDGSGFDWWQYCTER